MGVYKTIFTYEMEKYCDFQDWGYIEEESEDTVLDSEEVNKGDVNEDDVSEDEELPF